ncbi:hypothetical protein ISCU110981_17230 [Isoptericola cucumis]
MGPSVGGSSPGPGTATVAPSASTAPSCRVRWSSASSAAAAAAAAAAAVPMAAVRWGSSSAGTWPSGIVWSGPAASRAAVPPTPTVPPAPAGALVPSRAATAAPVAPAEANRRAGFLAIARATNRSTAAGTAARRADGAGTGAWTWARRTSAGRDRSNGGCPVSAKYASAPTEYRSLRASSGLPWACSGDMYAAEPATRSPSPSPPPGAARPRSSSPTVMLPSSRESITTLRGLTSRCTRPASCTAPSASSSPPTTASASGHGRPCPDARSDSGTPGSRRMRSHGTFAPATSSSPVSSTLATPGWSTRSDAAISRASEARVASSSTRCGWRTLTRSSGPGEPSAGAASSGAEGSRDAS